MIDSGQRENENVVPAELLQAPPRKLRLAGRGIYYLVGSMLVSMAIIGFAVVGFSVTERNVKHGIELARDGRLAYTADVKAGGMHLSTVYYGFVYDRRTYRGEALLPRRYLNTISDYNKSGDFPVLFLPRNPSINHPYAWRDDESHAFAFLAYVLVAIVVVQWFMLGRFILRDLKLARNGAIAVGTVTKCAYGKNGIRLRYDFRDMDELPAQGSGEYPTRQNIGAQICILYVPTEPAKSRPYPLVFFRVVG